MKGLLFEIEGNWAHFKKPETNNNPLTHDFITKTALIGLIGAVLGVERSDMRPLFPQLSKDLLYGVQIVSPVKKESWSFKLRYATNLYEKRPVQMEFLKNPRFTVALALLDDAESESAAHFDAFSSALKANEARFTPVLGLHNCPANLAFKSEGEFTPADGEFQTKGFVTANQPLVNLTEEFRIGADRMPTFQNDDWWNLPERYIGVFYPSEGRTITARGTHFTYTDESRWALI
jgi:CRISPR-associated protein Cas5 subtype I-B